MNLSTLWKTLNTHRSQASTEQLEIIINLLTEFTEANNDAAALSSLDTKQLPDVTNEKKNTIAIVSSFGAINVCVCEWKQNIFG